MSGFRLPEAFGKYSLVGHLATGGMAEVYIARQAGMGGFERLVVIKRVRPDLMADREFTRSLLAEARLVATLQHPNIAHVYEIGRVNESYFIVMEYLPGSDLRQLMERAVMLDCTVSIADAIYIVIQACIALHYAHEKRDPGGLPQGIIHRDVSPSNVLLSQDGAVKVCDFGIAKATRLTAETEAGTIKGKYGYMSPEQCRGLPLDRRTDIFALGIVLYELSTLTRAFVAANDLELLRMIVRGPPLLPSTRVRRYPRDLERIVMRALATDPADRYPTAQAMQLDLEELAREHKLGLSSVNIARLMYELFGEEPSNAPRATLTHRLSGVRAPLGLARATRDRGAEPRPAMISPLEHTWPGLGSVAASRDVALPLPPPATTAGRPGSRLAADEAEVDAPRPRRPSAWWLAGTTLAGLAAAGLAVAGHLLDQDSDSTLTQALASDADRIAGAFEVSAHLAHARAAGIATSPVVRAAIDTDAATLSDIAEHESALAIGAGETLDVIQLRDGVTSELLHLPAAAPRIAWRTERPARTAVIAMLGATVMVVAEAPVTAAAAGSVASASRTAGTVTVATPVDLGAARRQLASHAVAARLRGPGLELDLVGPSPASHGTVITFPLPSVQELGALELVAVAPPPAARRWFAAAQLSAVAIAALFLAGYAWHRRS